MDEATCLTTHTPRRYGGEAGPALLGHPLPAPSRRARGEKTIYIDAYIYIYLYIYLSVSLSICLSIYLYRSIYLPTYLPTSGGVLSLYICVCVCVLKGCSYVFVCVCMSVC